VTRDRFKKAKDIVVTLSSRAPCLWVTVLMVVSGIIVLIGSLTAPLDLETDFSSFMEADVDPVSIRLALNAAKEHYSSDARRLQSVAQYDLEIVYTVDPSLNRCPLGLISLQCLSEIAAFENALTSDPQWSAMCDETTDYMQPFCRRGKSIVNYGLATLNGSQIEPTAIDFTIKASKALPAGTLLDFLEETSTDEMLLPTDCCSDNYASQIRTFFRFEYSATKTEEWEDLAQSVVIPYLMDKVVANSTVTFYGDHMHQLQVMNMIWGDVFMCFGSSSFVFAYICFHTQTFLVSFLSMVMMLFSVGVSYYFFILISGITSTSLAFLLSLYLVVGLGSDVVFVYTDLWKESYAKGHTGNDRILWTLLQGGRASLATTVTTSVSFFANLCSVLRPLREFGVFMGICVVAVWIYLTITVIPFLTLEERLRAWLSRRAKRCRKKRQEHPEDEDEYGWNHHQQHQQQKQQQDTAAEEEIEGAEGIKLPAVFGTKLELWRRCKYTGLNLYMFLLFRLRWACLFIWVVLTGVFLGLSIWKLEIDTSIPEVLPEDHNINRHETAVAAFADMDDVFDINAAPKDLSGKICSPFVTPADSLASLCKFRWCDAEAATASTSTCRCARREIAGTCSGSIMQVQQRVIRQDSNFDETAWQTASAANFASTKNVSASSGTMTTKSELGTTMSVWTPGLLYPTKSTLVTWTLPRSATTKTSCGWEDVCFCGTDATCEVPSDWSNFSSFELSSSSSRRLGPQIAPLPSIGRPGRGLADTDYSSYEVVEVIFGINLVPSTPLLGPLDESAVWSFNSDHDISEPWAQRNLYSFCQEENLPSNLKVLLASCWISSFATYVESTGLRFPVEKEVFHETAMSFLSAVGSINDQSTSSLIWRRDGIVKASSLHFRVDLVRTSDTSKVLDLMDVWDSHIVSYNYAASRYARDAFHSAYIWGLAASSERLVSSTIETLIVLFAVAFLGMLLFTRNVPLSLGVVWSTLTVVCGLLFFIVIVQGWAVGPIEVIAVIVFVGYAATYSLHIAHIYRHHGALDERTLRGLAEPNRFRWRRTRFALKMLGPPALGSAFTTAGCAVFLLFCEMTVFEQLGGVIISITIISITSALGPLCASLLAIGPPDPTGCCFRSKIQQPDGEKPPLPPSGSSDPPPKSFLAMCCGLMEDDFMEEFEKEEVPQPPPSGPVVL